MNSRVQSCVSLVPKEAPVNLIAAFSQLDGDAVWYAGIYAAFPRYWIAPPVPMNVGV